MPFASYNSVTFVAEQVSHHPPSECVVHSHNVLLCIGNKFRGLVPNARFRIINKFKFGGMVWYRHMYIRLEEILAGN